jgi:hypothetical protein
LRDKDTRVISENRASSVEEIRSQFDRDWNFCQLFKGGSSLDVNFVKVGVSY